MRTPATSRLWSSSWLVTESGRYNASFALAFLVALPAGPLSRSALGFGPADSTVLSGVTCYAVMLSCYSALTLAVFSRNLDGCLAGGRGTPAPSLVRRLLTVHRPGAAIAVTFAAIALATAVWFASFAPGAETPAQGAVAALGTVLLVAGARCTTAVTSAADDARRESESEGLDLPGGGPLRSSDFLHSSAAVSTTFGTTDVTVTSGGMRRVVLGHSLVAFSFNTVILALLVSALLS